MSFRAANLLRVDNVELQRSQNGAKESTKLIIPDQNTQEFIKGKPSLVSLKRRKNIMIFSVRRAQCIIPHKVTRNAIPTRSCHRM